MASISVTAPDDLSEWVQRRIANGDYASASDYLLELIRRDKDASTPELTVADIRISIEDSRANGEVSPAKQVFERIERKLREMTD